MTPFLALALLAAQASESKQPPATSGQVQANQEFIVLLRLRYDLSARYKASGKWPDDKAANEALSGHVRYWKSLRDQKVAILAGGMGGEFWDNNAIIIFRAPSLSDAEKIVGQDPAVQSYVFQAQVRPFDLSWANSE